MDTFDLETWLASYGGKQSPFPNAESHLSRDEIRILNRYQFGAFSNIHATGSDKSILEDYQCLSFIIESRRDIGAYTVYRGLADLRAPTVNSIISHDIVSAWSLFPAIAIRIAMAQGRNSVLLLEQKMTQDVGNMYVDDWEHEVILGQLTSRITSVQQAEINYDQTRFFVYRAFCDMEV